MSERAGSSRRRLKRLSHLLALVTAAGMLVPTAGQAPAAAQVTPTSVKGWACGYISNVGLFRGPQAKLGCEPQVGTVAVTPDANTLSPSVVLPSGGSASAITANDPDGARAFYDPAVLFGGKWLENLENAPPSGPISVSTQGTPAGGVTSAAHITLHPTPVPAQCDGHPNGTTNCTSVGGYGPITTEGDELHVSCSASGTGVSGTTSLVNSFLTTSTNVDGFPVNREPVPANPPVNYTRHGVISNVGDTFTAVFNEHIVNSDGSLTVNGIHMYLFGPTAVGEVIKGQVTCGTTPSAVAPNDTRPPTCGRLLVETVSNTNPAPKVPRVERIGVFDTGGLKSITGIVTTNATVHVGHPTSSQQYLKFTPGQTGPLHVTATRIDESLPMSWSFDATDSANNVSQCGRRSVADFDGNGTTDISLFRPSEGMWYVHGGLSQRWGASGDIPVPGDYDGNGTADLAVYRPSEGVWYVNGTATQWGASGDVPVPYDYDGNGTTDMGIFRPSTSVWYVNGTDTQWGASGDIPVPGDYNGDGRTDMGIFRPSTNVWYVNGTATAWGASGDVPVPGDYNGDGKTDLAVYRPSNNVWYFNGSAIQWGASGDIPVPGDYNGDGKTDLAVFRPSQGLWFVNGTVTRWGISGDIPLPLPYAIRSVYFP